MAPHYLQDAVRRALLAAEPAEKGRLTRAAADLWRAGRLEIAPAGRFPPPDVPARPSRPVLQPPRQMPRRRAAGTRRNRIALLHSLAHIELNAIDLANDLLCRFAGDGLPRAFVDDWLAVAEDEALHFGLVEDRLRELGGGYGQHPAHDGLWSDARTTAGDLLARLAVVPLVLEARGLDVTPAMAKRLAAAGDEPSAKLLDRILQDEVTHVAAGRRWFEYLCRQRGMEPHTTFQRLVRLHFKGTLKPPFNVAARRKAGFSADYYEPLAANQGESHQPS